MQLVNLRITRYRIALLAIVLLGLALRAYLLTAQSIWDDEAFSIWISKLSLSQIVPATAADVHPPFYYFLLHYWMAVFGSSEGSVRFLSLVFGVLAIAMIYAVGRELFNEEVGLIGALLLALSSLNIKYSQETRMYSLMVLLALISMYFFIRFLQRNTVTISIGYIISTTLLLYTHVYGAFIVIAQNIFLLTLLVLSRERAFRLRHWIALEAIVTILFVPWMIVLISRTIYLENTGFWVQSPTVVTVATTLGSYAGSPTLFVLFLILSVLSLFTYYKMQGAMNWTAPFDALTSYAWQVRLKNIPSVCLLVAWVLTINILPFIISYLSIPIYVWRYTIAASVAFYLLVAAGISNINWQYAKVGIIIIIGVLCVTNLQPYYTSITRPQAREAINTVVQNFNIGDLAIVWPKEETLVFSYYNTRADLPIYPLNSTSISNITNETHSRIEGHERIWLALGNDTNQQVYSAIQASLNESYALSFSKHTFHYDVYLLEKRT